MKAVILAAGKSTRTYPLTLTRPKPLLVIANKTILEHNLEQLSGLVGEVILIVGYKQNSIRKFLGNSFKKMKITYIVQKEQKGTAHAVSLVEAHVQDRFILLLGDNLYFRPDIEKCLTHQYSLLVTKVNDPENFGVVVEKKGIVHDLIEKPKVPVSNMIIAGVYVLDKTFFIFLHQVKASERGEKELPDALRLLMQESTLHSVASHRFFSIGFPWDLLQADLALRKGKNAIDPSATITGNATNCSIGSGCVIKGNVRNSLIMNNTIIEAGSVVDRSVVGERVKFKGEIKIKKKTVSWVKGVQVNAGEFGAVVGDGVSAREVVVMPGCKIWPEKKVRGLIERDVM